ncbi:helix-turn-helix domain-containing protein [Streptomyces caniscabiei]|uniref:Helix-turn-helix domain-containing protein n=1 Tax=Streptomyces caniscabiei TaxID=2746961 RepID=A0ABU4N292_9ACTN|nr:helix-turn-helix domain-containing protein [Streptomyces caniscabiei]MBE4790334.1 helix-turn-helix domain-containing protein [Streptomyces caniscabiei]MBE4799437.1 helix-turn-helix domain-containing protein [Streptomyces caniscabiei]MDX3015191.1 helix-turn-helix domain-containing protein [Streptomyces caniscabiei]MDX3042634.1 helix-turn-helix domain-containing protein [Streptomyces caniscabiei]
MPPNVIPGTRRFDLPDAEITARYDAGESVLPIAEAYGVSTPVIYRILREQGRTLRLPRTTPQQRDAVVALYQTGLSDTEVAKRLGLSRTTVRKIVAEAGVKRLTPQQLAQKEVHSPVMREIVRRRQAGETVRSLATEYGIARNTLARRLARAQDGPPGDPTGSR